MGVTTKFDSGLFEVYYRNTNFPATQLLRCENIVWSCCCLSHAWCCWYCMALVTCAREVAKLHSAILLLGDRDSAVGIASRYGLNGPGDRIPVEARFSASFQTRPGAHPAFCTMGTGYLPGVKRQGGWCWPPTSIFSAEVLNWVELYLYPP